jgi:hypothetical protein
MVIVFYLLFQTGMNEWSLAAAGVTRRQACPFTRAVPPWLATGTLFLPRDPCHHCSSVLAAALALVVR